jgi:hypothetical protein
VAERVRVRDFLAETLEAARSLLPEELRDFQGRLHGSLAKAYYDDPDQHFEVWLRRSAGRVELGLHFESRDRASNNRMLEWFADELGWIKAELGEHVEAEPWDRGWTRVHQTLALPEPLTSELRDDLASRLARMIELLEPLRRDAVESALPGATT